MGQWWLEETARVNISTSSNYYYIYKYEWRGWSILVVTNRRLNFKRLCKISGLTRELKWCELVSLILSFFNQNSGCYISHTLSINCHWNYLLTGRSLEEKWSRCSFYLPWYPMETEYFLWIFYFLSFPFLSSFVSKIQWFPCYDRRHGAWAKGGRWRRIK